LETESLFNSFGIVWSVSYKTMVDNILLVDKEVEVLLPPAPGSVSVDPVLAAFAI
jgi:hypothetical protein